MRLSTPSTADRDLEPLSAWRENASTRLRTLIMIRLMPPKIASSFSVMSG